MEMDDFKPFYKKYMDGVFFANFHRGILKGVGWDSRTTLVKHGCIVHQRPGPGISHRYFLLPKGERVIQKMISFFHNGIDPTATRGPGSGRRPGGAGGGGRPGGAGGGGFHS